MSRRRWARWLAAPPSGVVSVAVAAGVVVGCAGARPTVTAWPESHQASLVRGTLAKQTSQVGVPPGLIGRTWLAEGPRGWEAGRIGGPRVRLGEAEVGLAASDHWVVSAILRPVDSVTLLVREGPGAPTTVISLGRLAPTATVISGDRAYVSGFRFGATEDPGILEVDLQAGSTRAVLEPSGAEGTRYLAVSPDGSMLVSSLCDLAANPEPATCLLTAVALTDGVVRNVGRVPGGLLRGTSADVAVVAQQGHEAPAWVAGIDLGTGAELWRLAGGEFGSSVVSPTHGLIQQRLLTGVPRPKVAIEAVDLRTGARRSIYEETGLTPRSLWPALTSDTQIAMGADATGRRAILGDANGATRVRLVTIDGGASVDVEISLRSQP